MYYECAKLCLASLRALRVLRARVSYVLANLRAFASYVPSFFYMPFVSSYFYGLTCLNFLCDLRAVNFLRLLLPFILLHALRLLTSLGFYNF